MKEFNLTEYLKNPSQKVVTRDGREVRIICTDAISASPVIALVTYFNEEKNKIQEATLDYRIDGKYCNEDTNYDLVFAPIKREGWVNVYKNDNNERVIGCLHSSEEEAIKNKDRNYITTVKVEWEE